jgi:hypothetical protein
MKKKKLDAKSKAVIEKMEKETKESIEGFERPL